MKYSKILISASVAIVSCFISSTTACEPICRQGIIGEVAKKYEPVITLGFTDLKNLLHERLFVGVALPDKPTQDALTLALSDSITNQALPSVNVSALVYAPVFDKYRGPCPDTPATCKWVPNQLDTNCPAVCGTPGSVISHLDDVLNGISRPLIRSDIKAKSDVGGLIRTTIWNTIEPKLPAANVEHLKSNFDQLLSEWGTSSNTFCETGCNTEWHKDLTDVLRPYN